jgi:hypothetical protein
VRAVLLATLFATLAACGPDTPEAAQDAPPPLPPDGSRSRPFVGRGVVTEIRGDVIQIDHETIPGFMVAVTMDFPLEDPAMAAGIEPGDTVVFSIERTSWRHRVIGIEREAPAP